MRIEHIAIWTDDLDRLKNFYTKYFNAKASNKYVNEDKKFESYFLSFDSGTRLEIMTIEGVKDIGTENQQNKGYAHLAMSVGTIFNVLKLTNKLEEDGIRVIGAPRTTGDGYFESVVLDPDGNTIELTQ